MNNNIYNKSRTALRNQKASDALKLADTLIHSSNPDDHASGYLLRGIAFESGGEGLTQDFKKAVESYRQAACICPDAITFVYMARALMKQGNENHAVALKYILEAEKIRTTPEVKLAFAKYYETTEKPNYLLARKYYLSAALAGRFAGFFGYAETSRMLEQNTRAFFVDIIRILMGPVLFLLLGKTASKGF